VLTLVTLGEPMLDWFGPEFAAAYVALLLLAAAETIQGAFSVTDLLLLYLRARLALWVTVGMIVVHLVTAVPLIEAYGIDGAALSVLIAIAAGAVLRRVLLQNRFGLTTPLWHSAGPLLAAGVAGLAALAAHRTIAIHAPPPIHLGALAGVLAVYWAGLWLWQRTTGQNLRLTGFRTA
jgi:O-antigen/teichoic acid export membrane protein